MAIDRLDVLRLAGESGLDPRTVRRAYSGKGIAEISWARLIRAVRELELPSPPPAKRWGAP